MGKFVDITGRKFNRLTAIKLVNKRICKESKTEYEFQCDCGNIKILQGTQVKHNRIKSCGCLQKEKASDVNRLQKGESRINSIIRGYKRHAKDRNFNWNLTIEDIKNIIFLNCYYCNSEPKNLAKDIRTNTEFARNNNVIYNGIDRIDSKKGYSKENCVPCCIVCNRAKSDLNKDEFINHITKIYNHIMEK